MEQQGTIEFGTAEPVNRTHEKYLEWRATPAGQHAFALFERFAMQLLRRGRRFGISLLAERVRWEVAVALPHDEAGYRINNNHRAYIARELVERHPELAGLIETRSVKGEAA